MAVRQERTLLTKKIICVYLPGTQLAELVTRQPIPRKPDVNRRLELSAGYV
ncbi:MAG TPA: hypothetical protein PLE01_06400 [Syntrophothermus lipocalidus]|nr:hypothetical protein [Syntrophothermus lipocalidus]